LKQKLNKGASHGVAVVIPGSVLNMYRYDCGFYECMHGAI